MFRCDLILIYQSASRSRTFDKATLVIGSRASELSTPAAIARDRRASRTMRRETSCILRVSINCATPDWPVSEVTNFSANLLTAKLSHWCSSGDALSFTAFSLTPSLPCEVLHISQPQCSHNRSPQL
jgi:hypothetical protein